MNKKILLSTFIIGLLVFGFVVVNATTYPFTATSVTYIPYKPGGNDVIITVEFLPIEEKVRWTFDFPMDDDPGSGNMGYALVISFDQVHPKYQIHNNDGTCSAFPWGTHLYSPWDPLMGGWNGWHTSDPAWNTEVTDLDWISCTGERNKNDNPNGIFTVTISCAEHPSTIYWAAHFGAGGFFNYGGLSRYPEEWAPWSGDASDFETADGLICPMIVEIDIKPGSDPNAVNFQSNGVLPVAILGSISFDVTTIDPASVRLEGVAPLRWAYEDVNLDGYLDLVLKFNLPELAAAVDPVTKGDVLDLNLTGNLKAGSGGNPIEGLDTVVAKKGTA